MAFKSFDSRREHFEPYGLSCERWIPRVMPRTDRHNEIELNFLMSGSITYYFGDKVVTVPARKISVFWGLIPHKIIAHETKDYYYVCTVPLSMFLKWGMSDGMVNKIFTGELLVDSSESAYDQHLFFHMGKGHNRKSLPSGLNLGNQSSTAKIRHGICDSIRGGHVIFTYCNENRKDGAPYSPQLHREPYSKRNFRNGWNQSGLCQRPL